MDLVRHVLFSIFINLLKEKKTVSKELQKNLSILKDWAVKIELEILCW